MNASPIWNAFRDIEQFDVLGSFQLAYKFRIIYKNEDCNS